jgi:hypothetical protein
MTDGICSIRVASAAMNDAASSSIYVGEVGIDPRCITQGTREFVIHPRAMEA